MPDTPRLVPCAATLSLAALLVACSHAPVQPSTPTHEGRASYQRITEPAGTQRYQLAMGQRASHPVPRRNPDPVYPPSLLAEALPPVTIIARLSMDVAGRVAATWIPPVADAPPSRTAFEAAVRDAVRDWQFTPLKITTDFTQPNGLAASRVEAKPFSAWFRFRFAIVDGQPRTTSAAAPDGG